MNKITSAIMPLLTVACGQGGKDSQSPAIPSDKDPEARVDRNPGAARVAYPGVGYLKALRA